MLRTSLAGAAALALVASPAAASAAAPASVPQRLDSVVVEPGYVLAPLATGLDFPTGIAMDGERIWISEAGILPNDPVPKVVEIAPDGTAEVILTAKDLPKGAFLPPVIDVTHHEGMLWVTHRQIGVNDWMVGAVSRFDPADPAGTFTTVLTNLPSQGDHFTNEIIFGEDGRAYFTQGTATNTSVVGPDNELVTGWLSKAPNFHDYPAKDVVLSGAEYTTDNPLEPGGDLEAEVPAGEDVVTAPFMEFGSGPVDEGTVVSGATPSAPQDGIIIGNGTAYSFDPTAEDAASTLRLEAWGLRNPLGLGFDPFDPSSL
jgi:glucose/arabinose dehydrogenase